MDKIRDTRIKEKFVIDDAYLNGYARLCGIMATGVYLSLCRHSNKEQSCFPSKELIAKELSISERSVYSALKKLESWNIIKIKNQGKNKYGSFNNNIYILIDKSRWKTKPQTADTVGNHCRPPQAIDDIRRRQPLPNKELVFKDTHKKEDSSYKKKAYYNWMGEEFDLRFSKGRWWVIPPDGGDWLEFAGKESEIQYK